MRISFTTVIQHTNLLFWKCGKGNDFFNGSLFMSLSCLLVVLEITGLNSWEDAKFFELLKNMEDRPSWAGGRSACITRHSESQRSKVLGLRIVEGWNVGGSIAAPWFRSSNLLASNEEFTLFCKFWIWAKTRLPPPSSHDVPQFAHQSYSEKRTRVCSAEVTCS